MTAEIFPDYCVMSADLFVRSAKEGYDSKEFINRLMRSELAGVLYHNSYTQMWRGSAYIIETLETETFLPKGDTYPYEFMEWTGYLFEYWKQAYPEDSAGDMIRQAPVETLLRAYTGLHVMSFADAIADLKEMNTDKHK